MRNNTIIWTCLLGMLFLTNLLSAQDDSSKVELIFQKGHSRPIIVMAQSHDGKILATGGTDLIIRFRDLRTGIEYDTYTSPRWSVGGADSYISWVKFSANNKYLMCQVNSELFVHIVAIRLSDHKVVMDSYQNGTYGQVKSAFFTEKGQFSVICYAKLKGENGYMKRCNLETGKTETFRYYTYVPEGAPKESSKEHERSFVYGKFFTRNRKYLLTIGNDLRSGKKGRQVVFVMDLAKMKVIKRIVLPEIKEGLNYLTITDEDNQHFYIIPKYAGGQDEIYWKKYNIFTGKKVDEIPYTFDENKDNSGFRYKYLGLTTDDFLFFTQSQQDDSIRFVKLGKLKPSRVLYTKTAKGNTHIDRIQHLGIISNICRSHDAKSVFVAFCGTNEDRRKYSDYIYEEVADVITIRQIDIATGRVLREYASLGKEIDQISFHPNGKSLWITENYSSHAKNLKNGSNLSVLNIWKFRDIGNLYYEPIYDEAIDEVFLSPNRKEAVFQTNYFDDVRLFNTQELHSKAIYYNRRLKKEEGLQLEGLEKRKSSYQTINIRVNPSFTKLIDSKYNVYAVVNKTLKNKTNYLGQLDFSALKKQRKVWSVFMNQGTTNNFGVLSEGVFSKDDFLSSKLHFYNLDSCRLEGNIDFKAVFQKPFVAALNTNRTWLAFSPRREYYFEGNGGIESPVLYFVDLTKRRIHKRIELAACRDGTRYDPNTQTTEKVIAMCAQYPIYSLEFASISGHVLGGMFDNTIRIWEVESGKALGQLTGHESPVTSMSLHPKKKILVSADLSGQLIFWDRTRWNILAKMVLVGQDDYIIYTPKGYYMATQNALDWVAFKKGDKLFRFDQFDIQYNRPDIVMDSLGLTNSLMIRMLKKAYKKRLDKLGLREGDFGDLHAPTLSINQEIPFETKEEFLTFDVTAEDTLYTLK